MVYSICPSCGAGLDAGTVVCPGCDRIMLEDIPEDMDADDGEVPGENAWQTVRRSP